jgi:hypothetical protein
VISLHRFGVALFLGIIVLLYCATHHNYKQPTKNRSGVLVGNGSQFIRLVLLYFYYYYST